MTEQNILPENHGGWWLSHNGTSTGPYDDAHILRGIKTGAISPLNFVCPVGETQWKPLTKWPQFAELICVTAESPPPPLNNSLPVTHPASVNNYDDLPWYRKSVVNTILIIASLLTGGLFPGTVIVCISVLSGEIYYNKKDDQGNLKTWHWSNKVVAILLLLLNIASLAQILK